MSELPDIVIGGEVAGPEGLAQGPASRIGVKSSDAPQGQPHTSPGQSEMASAMQRRPGSMGASGVRSPERATQSHAKLFRPFRAEIHFLGRVLGRRYAVPQADLCLPLRGEEEAC